eukprot:3713614-Rhodomonas_salina.1
MAESASHPPPQSDPPEVSGPPAQDCEDASFNGVTGQQNDAAKALLGLNNVVDLPYQMTETPPQQGQMADLSHALHRQREDSGGMSAADENQRIPGLQEMVANPPAVPMMMMQRPDPSMEASPGAASNPSANIQSRQAADAQYQLASALHMIHSGAPQDSGKGPKKKRKKGGKGNQAENEQDQSGAGRADGTAGLPFDPQRDGQ